jgi:molybdopterin-binding protein
MKISARNVFEGRISALKPGPINTEVSITLPGGTVVHAVVTRDAVAELGLALGVTACAVIKASHVLVAVAPAAEAGPSRRRGSAPDAPDENAVLSRPPRESALKMILNSATTPSEYVECLDGWQRRYVEALRATVTAAAPALEERLKWGHLVYVSNGPVLLIRAEPSRVLFGFWRGQRLRHIEPRLKPGGKYEMATLELLPTTPLAQATVVELAQAASALNQSIGDPTAGTA